MGLPSIDRLLLRRLKLFLSILFMNNQGRFYASAPAFALFTFLIAVADQIATYFVGILPSEFFVALGGRDLQNFKFLLWKSALIVSSKSFVLAINKYATSLFFLKCREICNRSLHRSYFQNLVFYKLNFGQKFDNPDQRMTQDVEKLTRIVTHDLFNPIIMAPFTISYYTYLTFQSAGFFGVIMIYLYFTISTVLNKFLLSPIVRLGMEQEKEEGNFRTKHLDIRSHSEAIAFYNSGETEELLTNEKFVTLLKVQKRLAIWKSFLCLVTSFFDYYGGSLSYLIIAIPTFWTHRYDHYTAVQLAGIVSKNAFIYIYLIYNFSRVVSLAEVFGEMSAVTHRVIGLYEELRKLKNETDDQNVENEHDGIDIVVGDRGVISTASKERKPVALSSSIELDGSDNDNTLLLHNAMRTFDHVQETSLVMFDINGIDLVNIDDFSLLIKELTFQIVLGQRILITGESGTGKTSLLRVIAGIWLPKSGTVGRNLSNTIENIVFLPQDPYFPNGHTTLAQQLIYPLKVDNKLYEEAYLMQILKNVGLSHLLERFSSLDKPFDGDWNATLSKGELQKLSIARVLYHKPKLAFLDECTSAVGKNLESLLYELLVQNDITFVSVGHRENLRQFHHHELHLEGHGKWSFTELAKVS